MIRQSHRKPAKYPWLLDSKLEGSGNKCSIYMSANFEYDLCSMIEKRNLNSEAAIRSKALNMSNK